MHLIYLYIYLFNYLFIYVFFLLNDVNQLKKLRKYVLMRHIVILICTTFRFSVYNASVSLRFISKTLIFQHDYMKEDLIVYYITLDPCQSEG